MSTLFIRNTPQLRQSPVCSFTHSLSLSFPHILSLFHTHAPLSLFLSLFYRPALLLQPNQPLFVILSRLFAHFSSWTVLAGAGIFLSHSLLHLTPLASLQYVICLLFLTSTYALITFPYFVQASLIFALYIKLFIIYIIYIKKKNPVWIIFFF